MAEPKVDAKVSVVYEDDKYIAVSKSGNMPVHEGGLYKENCLTAILEKKLGYRVYPIYRLDRETSGIVVFAKKREYVKESKVENKEYIAIIAGKLDKEITVDKPIGEVKGDHIKWKKAVVKNKEDGKESITKIFPMRCNDKFSLVKISPLTGRQHQIRVHLQHIGHPILGDKVYGESDKLFKDYLEGKEVCGEIKRQALHLARITLNGKTVEAKIPDDIDNIIQEI